MREYNFDSALRLLDSRSLASSALAKALRARCLQRMRRGDEALALAHEVMRSAAAGSPGALDADALSHAAFVMRAGGDSAQVAPALEAACAAASSACTAPGAPVSAHATSVALQRCLVLAHFRAGDWKRMQQAAMRLAKAAVAAKVAEVAAAEVTAELEGEGTTIKRSKASTSSDDHARTSTAAAGSEYMSWAVLALHCATNDGAVSGTDIPVSPAPNPITGGGRGIACRAILDAGLLRSLALGETMLVRALDVLGPRERSSEALGLLVHTLVRVGRPADAYRALLGRFCHVQDADASLLHLLGAGCDSSVESKSVAEVADGKSPFVNSEPDGSVSESAALTPPQKSKKGKHLSTSKGTVVPSLSDKPPSVEPPSFVALPSVRELERTADDWIAESADGLEGRGVSPGPLLLVDLLRHAVYLLTLSASLRDSKGLDGIPLPLGIGPGGCGGHAVGTWEAARSAITLLLTDHRTLNLHDDWACHAGLAVVCTQIMVRDVCAAIASNAGALVASFLSPLSVDCVVLTGDGRVDSSLRPFLLDIDPGLLFSDKNNGSTPPISAACRGRALSVILQQAVRLEILHRLKLIAVFIGLDCGALDLVFESGCTVFVHLLCRYISSLAHKACCFSDVRLFLPTLLPPSHANTVSEGGADSKCVEHIQHFLLAFLGSSFEKPSSQLGDLSLPFMPVSGVGQSSDQSPLYPQFRFSFAVPRQLVVEKVLPLLERIQCSSRPNAAMDLKLRSAIVSARARALEASDCSEKHFDERNIDPCDPHGVADALQPARELVFSLEEEGEIFSARGKVRAYSTAMQLLRYFGVLSFPSTEDSELSTSEQTVSLTAEQTLRAAVDEIVVAWRHTLSLGWAATSGQREGLEGDDLPILAAHILWEIAFEHFYQASLSPQSSSSSANLPSSHPSASLKHTYAARQAILESVVILQCALHASEHNAQARLALVKASAWLAAGAQLLTEYRRLRIKHVQCDTLAHLALPHLQRVGFRDAVRNVCAEVCDFHRAAARECGEHAAAALASGNLSSCLDLVRLRARLEDSATLGLARAGHAANALATHAHTLSEAGMLLRKCVLTGELPDLFVGDAASRDVRLKARDNEEHDAMSCWDAPRVGSPHLAEVRGLETLASFPLSRAGLISVVRTAQSGGEVALADIALKHSVLRGGSIYKLSLHHELCKSAGGGGSGVGAGSSLPTRLLRRALRERHLSFRQHTFGVLARCLEGGASSVGSASEALAKLKDLLIQDGEEVSGDQSPASKLAKKFLFADITSSLIPIVDTGISTERLEVREAAGSLLFHALSSAVKVSEAYGASWAGDAAEAASSSAVTSLHRVNGGVETLYELLVGAVFLPPLPVPSMPIQSVLISMSTLSEPSFSGPLNPAFVPETALFVQHTLALTCVALAHVLKQSQIAKSGTIGANITEAARACVSALIGALTSLRRVVENVKKGFDDGSVALVSFGYDPSACASRLASDIALGSKGGSVLDINSTESAQVSASKNKLKGKHIAAVSGTDRGLNSADRAAAYLAERERELEQGFREAARGAFQALAASYAMSLDQLHVEIGERLAWLHKI